VATHAEVQKKFLRFHRRHPEVYRKLEEMTRQARAKGIEKYSLYSMYQALRWHTSLEGLPENGEPFKLTNDFQPFYARLIMKKNPDLKGFFELRPLTRV